MPRRVVSRFLHKAEGGQLEVHHELRSKADFRSWNLLEPTYQIPRQDVIFCQNVLIYLSREVRLRTVEKLCDRLAVGGYLFLAPAEGVSLDLESMESVRFSECSAFRKVS